MKLRPFIQTVKGFTDIDECIDFVTDIISGGFSYECISLFARISSLYSIYFLRNDVSKVESSLKEYKSIKGIVSNIQSLCEIVQQDVRRLMTDLTPILTILSIFYVYNTNERNHSGY